MTCWSLWDACWKCHFINIKVIEIIFKRFRLFLTQVSNVFRFSIFLHLFQCFLCYLLSKPFSWKFFQLDMRLFWLVTANQIFITPRKRLQHSGQKLHDLIRLKNIKKQVKKAGYGKPDLNYTLTSDTRIF